MNCVHCDEALGNREYYYMTQRIPIHTACIGYADAELIATLFRTPLRDVANGITSGQRKRYNNATGRTRPYLE